MTDATSADSTPVAPTPKVKIYFSDFFGVPPATLKEYGTFDISLVSDLPLFIDPFLLFGSKRPDYQELHEEIIAYLVFLRDKAGKGGLDAALIRSLYAFKEVNQLWFGYTLAGNQGTGLGPAFARTLHSSLGDIFSDLSPRWTPQIRPLVDGSKPATTEVAAETG